MNSLNKLAGLGGPQLGGPYLRAVRGQAGLDVLEPLLRISNGFYAFESALHVLPVGSHRQGGMTIEQWNSEDSWRGAFGGLMPKVTCFAEDIFGIQWGVLGTEIVRFDPETAEAEAFAGSVAEWAERILADYKLVTGYPIAHDWQSIHGPLSPGKRLVPRQPFVLEGPYAVDNLRALDAAEGMRLRASLAARIANLGDGEQLEYVVPEV